MSSDPNQSERFFVPAAVIRFLTAITLPTHSDRVLNINLDSGILTPEIKKKADKDPDYIKSNPDPEDLEKLEQTYDIILCGPIFGIPAGQFPGGNGEPGEEFWLKWGINHLSKNGRFAVIVPNGLLANYSQQNFRKFLLNKCDILAILELPPGWSQGTNVQASILLITPSRDSERDIKMFRFSKFDTIPWDIVASSVLSQDEKISHKAFKYFTVKKTPLLFSERLDASYYDPKYSDIPEPDSSVFTPCALSEVVDISSGERLSKENFHSYGIPYIQVANIGGDGNLYLRDASFVNPEKVKSGVKAGARRCHCIRGDLIITVAGTVGKVTLIDDKQPSYGVYINTSSRRLRIKDTNVVLPEYLFIHLRSEIVQLQIARLRSGSVIPVLSSAELGKITVYIPPLEKQRQLISSLQASMGKQSQKILSRFYGIEQEPDTSHESKSDTKPATPSQPPLEEVVKEEFPFPIARNFSALQQSENEKYVLQVPELVAFSESIVYYLSSICIVDQMTRLKIASKELLSDIQSCASEHSINKRFEVISGIQRLGKRDTSINLFIPEITHADIGVCKELHERVRNSKSHTLPQSEFECREIMALFRPKLKRLLESIRFLKDYKLVRVSPVAYRNKRHIYKLEYFMKDSDLFQSENAEFENYLPVETGHVLLMNKEHDFLDLHPFYLFRGWENTGKKEHLCFFKCYAGTSKRDSSNKRRLKIESSLRAGEHDIDDDGLESLLNSFSIDSTQ
jgi:hypothetical protein